MLRHCLSLVLLLVAATPAAAEVSVTLQGSRSSMVRQNEVARENDYSFLRTASQVREMVEKGFLVAIPGNEDYTLSRVSFPYGRAELLTFVERLSAQYREGCGERLVVTSLTRPQAKQPGNAHELSVHPTGMAVDLRISQSPRCRSWLEGTLLSLEDKGLLDVTRERNPPHYHVAVFPGPYGEYAAKLIAAETEQHAALAAAAAEKEAERPAATAAAPVAEAASEPAEPKRPATPVLVAGILGLTFGVRSLRRAIEV